MTPSGVTIVEKTPIILRANVPPPNKQGTVGRDRNLQERQRELHGRERKLQGRQEKCRDGTENYRDGDGKAEQRGRISVSYMRTFLHVLTCTRLVKVSDSEKILQQTGLEL